MRIKYKHFMVSIKMAIKMDSAKLLMKEGKHIKENSRMT